MAFFVVINTDEGNTSFKAIEDFADKQLLHGKCPGQAVAMAGYGTGVPAVKIKNNSHATDNS
jgi:hypothetical protein